MESGHPVDCLGAAVSPNCAFLDNKKCSSVLQNKFPYPEVDNAALL